MPFQHTIDRATSTAYVVATGEITLQSYLQVAHDLVSDPSFQPELDVLVDLSEAEWAPTSDEAFGVGQAIAQFQDRIRGRVVSVPRAQFERQARTAAMTAQVNGFPIHVAPTLDDALVWLGLEA